MKKTLLSSEPLHLDLAALLARLIFGGFIILGHGWLKILFWMDGKASLFKSTLGLGPEIELFLAIVAEVFCGFLVVVGFQTRLASIPLIFAMFVASVLFHWHDQFFHLPGYVSNKEFAIVYGVGFILIFMLGPGKYSIDYLIKKR